MSREACARASGRTRRGRTATRPRSAATSCRCWGRAPAPASRASPRGSAPRPRPPRPRPPRPSRPPRSPPASSTTWKTTFRSEVNVLGLLAVGSGAAAGAWLRFYVHENRKQHGILLYEWLLETAKKAGIHGGSAFRAIAGYGRHGVLHEQHFFELAGDLTVEVEFLLSDEQAQTLLGLLRREQVRVFYASFPAEFGMIEGKAE